MAKEFCNKCQFAYEGGCQKHSEKRIEADAQQNKPEWQITETDPNTKPTMLDRVKNIFKRGK